MKIIQLIRSVRDQTIKMNAVANGTQWEQTANAGGLLFIKISYY